MSLCIRKRSWGPNKTGHVAALSTIVNVDVDVDVDIDLDDLVEDLDDAGRAALLKALGCDKLSVDLSDDGEPSAEEAYYAFARGDMETVRRFVCAAAGRIA